MTTPTPDDDGDSETLKLILDELTARFTRQIDASKGIDTKAGVVAGFAVTAATFLAGRPVQPVLAGAAYAGFVVAFVFAVAALRVTTYKDVPDAAALVNEYARQPKLNALRDLVVERAKAIKYNGDKQEKKATQWWIAMVSLAVGVVLSVLAVVVVQTDARDGAEQRQSSAGGGAGRAAPAAGRRLPVPAGLHGGARQLTAADALLRQPGTQGSAAQQRGSDTVTENQQADDSTTDAASSESSDSSTGDSFMDTYGNARLTTTEQRSEDRRYHEDKMIRRSGETKDD